jgi:hypothetical protein
MHEPGVDRCHRADADYLRASGFRWNNRYRDITSVSKEGRLVIDYAAFHEITPE